MRKPKQALKVAIVSDFPEHSNAIAGGVESAVWNLVRGLAEFENLKVYVIAPTRTAVCEDSLPGVTVIRFRPSRLPGFIDYWTLQRFRIRKILRRLAPDIVHYQALAGQAVFSDFPSVLTIHGIAEQDLKHKNKPFKFIRRLVVELVETYSRKRVDNLILINPYVRQFLAEATNYKEIPNAIDNRYFEVDGDPQNRNLIYVGRISKLKNILGMLKAFELLVKSLPDAHLNIIGEPEHVSYLAECKEFVSSSGLDKNVSFLGGKNVDEIREFMQKSSCLLLASRQENAPMVIAESLAVGVPVVASDCGGISHMFEDGRSGFLVDWDKPEGVVEKLLLLLATSSKQEEMACQAKQLSQRYRTKLVAAMTYDYYLEILNVKNEPPNVLAHNSLG